MPSHHSEKKARRLHEKAWQDIGKSIEEDKKSKYYKDRAETVENSKVIYNDDPNAIQKLKDKLEYLEKQKKLKNFLLTMICIVVGIELLQFITISGCCDIDDVILNVLGSLIMFVILRISSINKFLRNIVLLEKNKIDYKDLIKKIIIILIPIICIIGVVFISE